MKNFIGISLAYLFFLNSGCSTTRTTFLRNDPNQKTIIEKEKTPPAVKSKPIAGALAISADKSALVVPVFQVDFLTSKRTFQMKSQKVYDSFCFPGYRFTENCEKSYWRIGFWDFILGPISLGLIPYFSAEEKRSQKNQMKEDKNPITFKMAENAAVPNFGLPPLFNIKGSVSVCTQSVFSESVQAYKTDRGDTPAYDYGKKAIAGDYGFTNSEIDTMDYFVFVEPIEEPLVGPRANQMLSSNLGKFNIKDSSVIKLITDRSLPSEKSPIVTQRVWLGLSVDIFEEPKERPEFGATSRFPHFNDIQTESLVDCEKVTDLQMLAWVKDYNLKVKKADQKLSLFDLNLKGELVQKNGKSFLRLDVKKIRPFLKLLKNDLMLDLGQLGLVKMSPAAFN